MALVVGLTGGIGSGKSLAGEAFQRLGAPLIDADQLSREAVAPGSEGLGEVVARFGKEFLLANGELDRRLVRARIFRDPTARRVIEGIIHPIVRARMEAWNETQKSPYVIHMIPLLLEKRLEGTVDRVLVVDVPPERQISRVMARDQVSENEVRAILAAQVSREERIHRADDVIDNSRGLLELQAAVEAMHQEYLAMSLMKDP